MTTAAHTKGTWKIDPEYTCDIQGYDGLEIATTAISNKRGELPSRTRDLERPVKTNVANAAHIVLAVNSHDALVAALEEIISINDEDQGTFRKRGGTRRGLSIVVAREALAAARGEVA
jgi:hypothetical protein